MHRSLLLAGALGCACTTLPGGEDVHFIRAHWASAACAPAGAATASKFDLEALGDFPPSTDTSEELDAKKGLVVPGDTRGAIVTTNDGFSNYMGLGHATTTDADIDVSLWPAASPCRLETSSDDCDYPGEGVATSYSMGMSADGSTLVLVGGDDARIAKGALAVELATGHVACVPAAHGMQLGRSGAKIAPLGDKLLVSGGYDPANGVARGNAEVFDPSTARFEPELVAMNEARARHAAVSLASGEALLVGGVSEGGTPAEALEVIRPESFLHRSGLATLPARVDPVALRLRDDRIFVAGGTDAIGGSPLRDAVWLSPDATSIDRTLDALACPGDAATTTVGGAFTPMPGGAVLGVGGCTLALDGSERSCAEHCDGQPLGCPSNEIFWIDRDGDVACCGAGRNQCGAITTDAPPWTRPELVPGADGVPWLLEGTADLRRFHRFDPWTGQFDVANVPAGSDPATLVAADAGLFLWIDRTDAGTPLALRGVRHGVRGPYTQTVTPLLLAGTEGVMPDRAPLPEPDEGAPPALRPWRSSSDGTVTLPPGTELVVTDTTYADVRIVIHVTRGAAPIVRLGASVFGGDRCAWPARPARAFDAEVTRTGSTVRLAIGDAHNDCAGPAGRASIAIGAGAASVTVGPITVTRVAG